VSAYQWGLLAVIAWIILSLAIVAFARSDDDPPPPQQAPPGDGWPFADFPLADDDDPRDRDDKREGGQ